MHSRQCTAMARAPANEHSTVGKAQQKRNEDKLKCVLYTKNIT